MTLHQTFGALRPGSVLPVAPCIGAEIHGIRLSADLTQPVIDVRYHAEVFALAVFETEDPVVRVHPETGERSLLPGSFLQRFVGQTREESSRVRDLLQALVTAPENPVRWQAGDVVIWDNRSTRHVAVNDSGEAHRVARRVTLAGDVPVGPEGRASTPRIAN